MLVFNDTYACYSYMKEKGGIGDISKFGTDDYEKTVPKPNKGLMQEYRNLTSQEKRVYEEKANYLTSEEIRFVQIYIAPIFELPEISKLIKSRQKKQGIFSIFRSMFRGKPKNG